MKRPQIRPNGPFLEADGRPRQWITGEMQFSRVPRSRWRQSLANLRAMGMDAVASYVFWNHHQPHPDQPPSFEDRLDLAEFLRLAQDADLHVILRIGPWVHGEARYGGLPDWVAEGPWHPRSNDPAYLDTVRAWYRAIAAEVAKTDPGNVLAIQVENELTGGGAHLSRLKRLAEEEGLAAPLWFVTAWGDADFDRSDFLPVYGGYSDAFWTGESLGWVPECALSYSVLVNRDDPIIGNDVVDRSVKENVEAPYADMPWLTAELGGGMATAYHRRPHVRPEDVPPMALAKVASGVVLLGYFMAHGGVQPELGSGPLMESHDTGYANDLPLRDYDFQAPLGAAGQWRPHADELRLLHLGLKAMGEPLAGSVAEIVQPAQTDIEDVRALRAGIRVRGGNGIVAFNNYQPHTQMPAHPGVQVKVDGPDGAPVLVPPVPVDVQPGDHGFWPVGLELAPGLVLESATVQPVARVHDGPRTVWVFQPNVAGDHVLSLRDREQVRLSGSGEHVVGLSDEVTALITPRGSAARYWPTDAGLYRGDGRLTRSEDGWRWHTETGGVLERWDGDGWRIVAELPRLSSRHLEVELVDVGSEPPASYGALPPMMTPSGDRIGADGRASAPKGEHFAGARRFRVALPADRGPEDRLEVLWHGDVLRITCGDDPATDDARVVMDQFWFGDGLAAVGAEALNGCEHVTVSILGLAGGRPPLAAGQTGEAEVRQARWVPVSLTELGESAVN